MELIKETAFRGEGISESLSQVNTFKVSRSTFLAGRFTPEEMPDRFQINSNSKRNSTGTGVNKTRFQMGDDSEAVMFFYTYIYLRVL